MEDQDFGVTPGKILCSGLRSAARRETSVVRSVLIGQWTRWARSDWPVDFWLPARGRHGGKPR